MHKKTKIFISLFFLFLFISFFQTVSAKYVIENVYTVAQLNIDRCKPKIELIDIVSSNTNYPTYANKTSLISGHIKVIEKNIIKNNLSSDTIKIIIANHLLTPEFKNFSLVSENSMEKIYEFSFTNTTGDGPLDIIIPEGIIEDKSGLLNESKCFTTGLFIDNTPPVANFKETVYPDGMAKATISCNENIRPINGWNLSDNKVLSKEFSHSISYSLPITDFAQNSSEVMIHIQNANHVLLQYGSYDDYSKYTLVTGGNISSPKTILSNSICKSEAIFIKLSGSSDSSLLQGKCYLYTYWGNGANAICRYSKHSYNHGYNPSSDLEWVDCENKKLCHYFKDWFTQLGGIGLNIAKATSSNIKIPIPNNIANQYLYGISSIAFRLKNTTDFSIVYQSYVKDVGWLKASCDGQENLYQYNKPISAFRINIVPKTEKQYLINFWNRDIGTNHIN